MVRSKLHHASFRKVTRGEKVYDSGPLASQKLPRVICGSHVENIKRLDSQHSIFMQKRRNPFRAITSRDDDSEFFADPLFEIELLADGSCFGFVIHGRHITPSSPLGCSHVDRELAPSRKLFD